MSDESTQDLLNRAIAATQNTLGTNSTVFNYWYVSHELWGQVMGLRKNDATNQFQLVKDGENPYSAAGVAGTWLGKNNKKISKLKIAAHGKPGQFKLGQEITSANVAPLGGWLYSFFDTQPGQSGIEIVSCNAAADQALPISKCWVGQKNPPNAVGIPHVGYELLFELAKKSGQVVDGALYGLPIARLELMWTCRRVTPKGADSVFNATGGDPFAQGYC